MRLRYSLVAVGLVFMAGIFPSERFELYTKIHYFDKYMHFLGGFVIALFLFYLLESDFKLLSRASFLFFLVSATALIGVFWEFAEYLSNTFLAHSNSDPLFLIYRYFHGGDLTDTLGDLLMDLGGALTFGVGTLLTHAQTPASHPARSLDSQQRQSPLQNSNDDLN